MHGEFGDDEHPTVKQSPILISSRAKSPVKLDPDVYVKRSIVWPLLTAYTEAWFHWFPRFPDFDHRLDQVVPSAELSRTAEPMVSPYLWYWKATP
jgi:hypothetical protein